MEDSQGSAGEDDHDALEDHEGDFIIGQGAVESLTEFCDTERGPDENENGGKSKSYWRGSVSVSVKHRWEKWSSPHRKPLNSRVCLKGSNAGSRPPVRL